MSLLFDTVKQIEAVIQKKNLPAFKTKGRIALKAGFVLSTIEPNSPDDPSQLEHLKAAAREILGEAV